MLTIYQKEYLANLSTKKANKIVKIRPYDPKTKIVAGKIIRKIKAIFPDAKVKFMGASALKIAGLNDVDIWIFCSRSLDLMMLIFGFFVQNKIIISI